MQPQFEVRAPMGTLDRRPARASTWPALHIDRWRETYRTLHLYAQIVGKIKLALTPKTNQWWNVPFEVSTRGLRTGPMPQPGSNGERTFEMAFDFIRHEVDISDCDGRLRTLALVPALPVADFYRELNRILVGLGIEVAIRQTPCDIPMTTPFSRDAEHRTYLPDDAAALFQVLRRVASVLEIFRARFRGKCSPVQFFWGQFDLAVTRFNGWRIPSPSGSRVLRDRYDEESIAFGFWPGDAWGSSDERTLDAVFYSHTVPEPAGLTKYPVDVGGAYFDENRREFLLPYERVRSAPDPAHMILQFAEGTYDAGASLAGWNREELAYP
ncbi:DUF5996 family protein [Pendulispora brunnea]|uniref:DUF5996 family protein n=1 Tax=Pendulispora brunnea TaxID=2905690 RepID=A0ABZ2KFL9_9BACT